MDSRQSDQSDQSDRSDLSDHLDHLRTSLGQLAAAEQDYLAGFLLLERLKRNYLVMPNLHQRIEDANPENWQDWQKTKESLPDD